MQTMSNSGKRRLGVLVVGTVAVLAGVLGVAVLGHLAYGPAARAAAGLPVPLPSALLAALAALGAAGLAWLLLGVVLECLALAPGALGRAAATAAGAVGPRVARRVVAVAVGLGLGAGAGTGAPAAPASVRAVAHLGPAGTVADGSLPDPSWRDSPRDSPDPGWTPAPPRVRPQPDVAVLTGRPRRPGGGDAVVVRRGDSLWAIAARHLGEGATDAEIAAAWPRWYRTNRHVVGPDPDLIRPGQVLRPPPAAEDAS